MFSPLWEVIAHPVRFWKDKKAWALYGGFVAVCAIVIWLLANIFMLTTPHPLVLIWGRWQILVLFLGGHLSFTLLVFSHEWRHYRRFGRI